MACDAAHVAWVSLHVCVPSEGPQPGHARVHWPTMCSGAQRLTWATAQPEPCSTLVHVPVPHSFSQAAVRTHVHRHAAGAAAGIGQHAHRRAGKSSNASHAAACKDREERYCVFGRRICRANASGASLLSGAVAVHTCTTCRVYPPCRKMTESPCCAGYRCAKRHA